MTRRHTAWGISWPAGRSAGIADRGRRPAAPRGVLPLEQRDALRGGVRRGGVRAQGCRGREASASRPRTGGGQALSPPWFLRSFPLRFSFRWERRLRASFALLVPVSIFALYLP